MCDYKKAIFNINAKGYRKTNNGKYETFVSVSGVSKSLGTYTTETQAKNTVMKFRMNNFKKCIEDYGLNPDDGVLVFDHYIAFKSGQIFNLYGKVMIGMIDRCGYREVILNKKLRLVHRVIATAFIPKVPGKDFVNHKDGNKLNDDASNLEWCTRSENTKHAFANGLETSKYGEEHVNHKLNNEKVRYIRDNCIPHDKAYGFGAISRKLRVNRTTVSDAFYYNTWKNITGGTKVD